MHSLAWRLQLHPIVGSNDPKPDPIYASLRLAFHPKCAFRTQVHCTVPIKISNYPLSIFFLDPLLRIGRHYFRRENSGMVCIPNILSYRVFEYTIHGEYTRWILWLLCLPHIVCFVYHTLSALSTTHCLRCLPHIVCVVYHTLSALSTTHCLLCLPHIVCFVYHTLSALSTTHCLLCLPHIVCLSTTHCLRCLPHIVCVVYHTLSACCLPHIVCVVYHTLSALSTTHCLRCLPHIVCFVYHTLSALSTTHCLPLESVFKLNN